MNEFAAIIAQWALVIPAALVLIALVLRAQWREDLSEAGIAGIVTVALVKVAGALRFESRPFVVEHVPPLVPHVPDNAFPSDHLAAAGLAFAFLWPRSKSLAIVALLFAAAIGTARVIARLHWPIDIVIGFALGTLAVALTRAAFARKRANARR
jgi:membrane-associated phospholipid phosphatase